MPDRTHQSVRYMLNHAQEAHLLAIDRSRVDLDDDRAFALQLMRLMEVVGEASRRVPDNFRSEYPETDWRGFVGLRDILIHQFDAINYDILWGISQDELPTLIAQLEAILEQET